MMQHMMFGGLGLPRNASIQTFNQYRESEALNHLQTSVNHDGDLLDYETLELRVHPPNVNVLHGEGSNETIVTVDSANRPGTLVEVRLRVYPRVFLDGCGAYQCGSTAFTQFYRARFDVCLLRLEP